MNANLFLYDNRHTLCDIFLRAAVYLPESDLGVGDSRSFARDMIERINGTPGCTREGDACAVYKGLVRVEWACICASMPHRRAKMPTHDIAAMKDQMEAYGFNSLR